MVKHHYPLQALLYAVALHRYLRWRVPHYDVANHFGGVSYLFLRGMTGPSTVLMDGQSNGVFTWILPPSLVTDLSDLLDGRLVVR
jgi:exodeoxyribonuclease V beta subunit